MKPLQVIERIETFSDEASLDFCESAVLAESWESESDSSDGTCDLGPLLTRFQAAREAVLAAADLRGIQKAAVTFLQQSCEPLLLAWYHPAGKQIGKVASLEGLSCPAEGIAASLQDHLKLAAADCEKRNELCSFTIASRLRLFALPIPSFAGHCLLLVAEQVSSEERLYADVTSSLLTLSSLIGEWAMRRIGGQAVENARTVAALIELSAQVQTSDDADTACQRLVDSLQQHFNAEKVLVGLCRSGTSDVRLSAISGGSVVDRFSEQTRLIESVLQESLIRSTSGIWPVVDPGNRHALLSHQQLVESGFGQCLVSMPIQSETGAHVGSLLVVPASAETLNSESVPALEIERFLRAGAGSFAGCLSVLQKLADSRWLKLIRAARASFTTSRIQIAGWIASAVAMVLLLPMTYRVPCDLELQPVERRYIAAPFDAPLEECLVEPGDVVVKDQLLARMDGREIRWELAEVQANLNKATKERNTQLSRKEFGNAAISGHEMERLEHRAELLNHRNASLEIRSPADGIVVSGDHREAEGVPLEMGKTLFEIAPLDAMVVELCIPEEDVRHIAIGMTADIQLEAVPEHTIQGVIRSLHPRAELREGKNIFIAEADIPNTDSLLRPGMRGTAKISTRRHALGWNLFHKPAAWLLGWLGW